MSNIPVLKPIDFNPFEEGKVIEKITFTNDSQREIWVSCIFGGEEANLSYNESVSLEFNGRFDFDCFSKALKNLVLRHEALRSTVSPDGEKLIIYKNWNMEFALENISNPDEANQRKQLYALIENAVNTPLDLKEGPLFKVLLHKLNENTHYFTIIKHHIIGDGWSTGIMLEDLSKMYNSYLKGEEIFLARPYQISDYATEQARFKLSPAYQKTETYWLNQYKDKIPVLDLPTDHPRLTPRSYKAKRIDHPLTGTLLTQIKTTGAKAGASLVTTLLAAFEILLYSRTKQRDIVVGLPASGQSASGLYNVVGHCVNLLPLKTHVEPAQSFYDYLKKRKGEILDAYDHQRLTFGELIKKLYIPRDSSRVTLVPVIFNIDMGMDQAVSFDELQHTLFSNPRSYENFEIYLNASGSKNGILLEWSYNTDLFDENTIESFHKEYSSILEKIVKSPESNIALLTGIPAQQYQAIKPPVNVPSYVNQNINELILEAVKRYPEKTAVSFSNTTISYQQLWEKTDQLASFLFDKGVKPGDTVGLCADRSLEMLVFLLGILKVGAAYIPLDPSYPHERIEFMLQDAATKVLITNKSYQQKYNTEASEFIIEEIWSQLDNFDKVSRTIELGGNDLAYILYTSGSTGKPKGVKVTHHNLANFLVSMQNEPGISANDSLLAITTISFDIAGLELYLPLVAGAEVVIADQESIRDGRLLLNILKSKKITLMQATPSTWQMLIDAGWKRGDLSKVLCGGEALPKDLSEKIMARCDELWNMYGPTETTIWSTIKHIKPTDGLLTIGLPINNTQIYIVDEHNQEVAKGVSGEILIGGDGVAAGYLNRPELSNEKFIPDTFSNCPDSKVYRTGDIGIRLPNDEIQCLGRIDQQIKIRGHRIELGEIESILSAQEGIKQAVVIAREDNPAGKKLVGYIVFEDNVETVEDLSWKDRWETLYSIGAETNKNIAISDQNLDETLLEYYENGEDLALQSNEWLNSSVTRIKELAPKRIYEIGSGAGQILYELAPGTERYVATDYAETAIAKLNEKILSADQKKWGHISAKVASADDFTAVAGEHFDLILIHSVAQYFPNPDYLIRVIKESVKRIEKGGCLFIGDMQGKNSLQMCHAMDHLPRASDSGTLSLFKDIIENRTRLEDELVADPGFFFLLKKLIPEITDVSVQLRSGTLLNETTKYHYDVWLYVGEKQQEAIPERTVDWSDKINVQDIEDLLLENPEIVIEIKGVLNARTVKDLALIKLINAVDPATSLKEIRAQVNQQVSGIHPDLFWDLGKKMDFKTYIRWTTDGTDGLFDVIFIPAVRSKILPYSPIDETVDLNIYDFSRLPFSKTQVPISREVSQKWKKNIAEMLPGYMVPEDFIGLRSFPLTPNLKIDRKALPKPIVSHSPIIDEEYKPETENEKLIAKIWSEVLEIENLKITDDFFELGGHSLLAMKVMIAIEKESGKRLPLATLFDNSTIQKLALMLTDEKTNQIWDAIIPIKTSGNRTPLFLIHGGGLNILLFKSISDHFSPDQPIYGIQALGLNKETDIPATIEGIASKYVDEMIKIFPNGPYAIAGYSLGGYLAFEIAKQLKAMDKEIKLVGVMDTYVGHRNIDGNSLSKFKSKLKRQFVKIPFLIESFINHPKEAAIYQWQIAKYKFNRLFSDKALIEPLPFTDYELAIYNRYSQALSNYSLSSSDIEVTLFRVKKRLYFLDDRVFLGWNKFAGKGVCIYEIPGDHRTFLYPPNGEKFAGILQDVLDRDKV